MFALIQAENKQEMSESYGNQGLQQAGHYFAETYTASHYNLKATLKKKNKKNILCCAYQSTAYNFTVIKNKNFFQILFRFFRNTLLS